MTHPPLAAAVPDATSPRSVRTTRWPSAAKKYAARHPMIPAPITTTSADRVMGCEFRRGRESYLGNLWNAARERTLEITGATSPVAITRLEAISMGTSEEQALRARLLRLEQRLVMFSVIWVFTLVVVLLVGPWLPRAATQPQVIRTPALEIVDAGGRVRATLDAVNSKPSLGLFGGDGRRRGGLTVGIGGAPEFALVDPQGRPRISLRVGFERAAEIRITDGRSEERRVGKECRSRW